MSSFLREVPRNEVWERWVRLRVALLIGNSHRRLRQNISEPFAAIMVAR